jgi:UDP-2,4-diacetamido-2,4,6-trideoxy-beta-L-altropyranose hydrolase
MAQSTPAVEQRLREEGVEVECLAVAAGTAEDARATGRLAGNKNAEWIVLDGYHFNSAYQFAIEAVGLKLFFIDDNAHAASDSADLVLNQNLPANAGLYAQREPSTRLLLGPRYAMLRREFRKWDKPLRVTPEIGKKILVTMGGSDPNNVTIKVIEAMRQLSSPGLETVVMVGGSNPHLHGVEAAVRGQKTMRLVTDSTNVPELMAWADVAVAGAGTTLWEMCCMGLPSILLVLAENQKCVAVTAGNRGIAWNLGEASAVSESAIAGKLTELLISRDIRASQSETGRKFVDGRGALRVVSFLSGLELRRTLMSDCEAFWEWASDPDARTASFRSKPISWDEHAQWFRAKLGDSQSIFYTAANKSGQPIGAVRYQIEGNRAVLSIALGARFRGSGRGQKLLGLATARLFEESEVDFIDAYVKPANEASLRLFAGAGFERLPSKKIEGQEGVHFMLPRSAVA